MGTTLHVEIVTHGGVTYSGDATAVVAPGSEGELGILPNHAPLMTALEYGPLLIRHGNTEETIYIGGGFMEVFHDQVTILADDADLASNLDAQAAEAARDRAESSLQQEGISQDQSEQLRIQLQRAMSQLKVLELVKQRRRDGQ
jgi:F-type H+-transporting ATPase subunit epsilon